MKSSILSFYFRKKETFYVELKVAIMCSYLNHFYFSFHKNVTWWLHSWEVSDYFLEFFHCYMEGKSYLTAFQRLKGDTVHLSHLQNINMVPKLNFFNSKIFVNYIDCTFPIDFIFYMSLKLYQNVLISLSLEFRC